MYRSEAKSILFFVIDRRPIEAMILEIILNVYLMDTNNV